MAAPSVRGPAVLAALTAGVSPDPAPGTPYSNYRKVVSGNDSYYLGGSLTSYTVTAGFPGASGIGLNHIVEVQPQFNGGVITSVKANGLTLEGAPLDLRNATVTLDQGAGTWRSGDSFAALVVQSVSGQPDLMRVCWNAHLPPPAPVTGPPGYEPMVRSAPFKRLMCGVYSKQGGPSVGGYLADDFNGTVRNYSGSW